MNDPTAPRVSVIIPTHNRATLLPRALASVRRQSFTDFEVIVVDDGSSDETVDLLGRVDDPRVRWVQREHGGVSAARNHGIDLALGEWVAFLDDDNEWLPRFLERQLATVDRSAPDVVYSQGTQTGPGANRPHPSELPRGDVFGSIARGWHPFMSSVMVRHSQLTDLGGFSTALTVREDTHLLVRLALAAQWDVTPESLVVRHAHDGFRLSDDIDRARRAYADLDRLMRREIIERRGHLAYARWFRWHRGQGELTAMIEQAPWEGRSAAWRTLLALSHSLPWSAIALVRPVALLVLGPRSYATAASAYDRVRSR